MSIVSYLVLALALAINTLLLLQRCAEASPMRLTAGLAVSLWVAVVHTALFLIGIALGDMLRVESPDTPGLYVQANAYIFLGMNLFVALKTLFPYLRREPQLPAFALGSLPTVLALAAASGINVMLSGLGVGFVSPLQGHFHRAFWPLFTLSLLLGYIGIMFGRQKVKIRPRRWAILSALMLLGVAIVAVVNA